MSEWTTPPGSLGDYTQGQPLSITLVATSTMGGTITYVMANYTTLPPGLTLNATTGVISGTPGYVAANIEYDFQISADETVDGVVTPEIQDFSVVITSLVWDTPAGSIGVFSENSAIDFQFTATPSQNTNTVSYVLLNGSLPVGTVDPVVLSSTGLLSGTPDSIISSTTYEFTIRATEYDDETLIQIKDRTFTIRVQLPASSIPQFTTPQGALFTAYDSTWQQFQIQFTNPDVSLIPVVELVLGALPPGLEVSPEGLIRGWPLPPVDGSGNPTTTTSTFTLQIRTSVGSSLAQYTITIANQELQGGFIGRAPAIFNTQPQSFVITADEPYAAYYRSGNNLGDYLQATDFIFKIIGHNFDTNSEEDLVYEINGLFGTGNYDQYTGWINSLLPTIGAQVETFNFTARVYRQSQPTLTSDTLFLQATLIGDIDTRVVWVTAPDLGTINNGAISDLSVLAAAVSGTSLNYRIISTELADYNMKTIVAVPGQFDVFGDRGIFVVGTDSGETWTPTTPITSAVSFLYFNSAVYDVDNDRTILVGYNQTNTSVIYQIPNDTNDYIPCAVTAADPLNKIIIVSSIYIAVGDNGTITTTSTVDNWTTTATTGTTNNLNGICYGDSTYVAVGDNGTILTSTDTVTWTQETSGTTVQLNSVAWDGTNFCAVGKLGVILTSTDAATWTTVTGINTTYNFTAIVSDGANKLVACGLNGVIITSVDNGLSWVLVQNLISTADLYDVFYDETTTNFYMVGDGGTILQLDDTDQLSSPTVTGLPPDLVMTASGDIAGRLAFESTNSVVDQYVEKSYTFTVQAYGVEQPQITNQRTFTLTTVQKFYLPYDNVYIQALMSLDDRQKINQLLYNDAIIPREQVYRLEDPYFGVAKSVKYEHIYGVPSIAADDFYQTYIDAVQINHYWRNVTLGEIKTATATNENGVVLYEVVYSQVIDNLVTSAGVSIAKEIVWPRNIDLHLNNWVTSLTETYTSGTYIPGVDIVKTVTVVGDGLTLTLNSVEGLTVGMNILPTMGLTVFKDENEAPPVITAIDTAAVTITINVLQDQLVSSNQLLFNPPLYDSLTSGIARTLYPNSLPNMRQQIYDAIGRVNDTSLLPLWMTSVQTATKSIIGYTPAWVICYTKPGFSAGIAERINTIWPYKLNAIDFELDRFEVDRSKTYNYLGTTSGGAPIWNTLPSAQPNVIGNSADSYIYFPRKTILPTQTQG